MTSVFNPMFSASKLEGAATAALREWFPTYLRAFEKQENLPADTFPTPENYTTRNTFDSDAGEALPKIVVLSPGIIGAPAKRGNGKYSATWRLGIGIANAASTEDEADMLVKSYAAVAKAIILENSGFASLGAVEVLWTDETYVDLAIPNQLRQYKAASLFFNIDIDGAAFSRGGPTVPDQDNTNYGKVAKVFVDIEKEDIRG